MKSLVWTAPRRMEMQETETPVPAADEVLLRVAYVGICGSELSGYLGQNKLRVPPLVMGHEFSGTIEALGSDVSERFPDLALGMQAAVNPLYCAGESELQEQGLPHLCPTRRLIGAHRPGAYAEYVAVPASTVYPLPDSLSMAEGAMAEPVAVAVRIGDLAGNIEGQTCLIMGAGPIGLLALQVFLMKGAARVFVGDLSRERLAMASDLGGNALHPQDSDIVKAVREASRQGLGAAVALDAVGAAVTREQCVSATRSAGTVILSGLHEETSTIPAADIIRREIVVRGAFAYTPGNFAQAVDLLASEKVRLAPWIVEAPLSEGGKWFDRLIDAPGDVAKVLLRPGAV